MISSTKIQPVSPTSAAGTKRLYIDFCAAYQTRELALNLVTQLNHLVKAIQQHRGISMGLLAGNRAFEEKFNALQKQIDRRLLMIDIFSGENGRLISLRDKDNIKLAWTTIRQGWQDDKVSDNFELHSHFIEQLFQLNLAIGKTLEAPPVDESGFAPKGQESHVTSYSRQVRQIELLTFICSLLPTMVENLAKIRGLASFAAAVGGAQYDHDRRLRYFLQCAREQNDKLRQCARRLHEVLNGEFKAKIVIGELEAKFVHLIELVTHDVLSGKVINSSSSQLFNLATVLIDKYWSMVDEGLDIIRFWHRVDLENWIVNEYSISSKFHDAADIE